MYVHELKTHLEEEHEESHRRLIVHRGGADRDMNAVDRCQTPAVVEYSRGDLSGSAL